MDPCCLKDLHELLTDYFEEPPNIVKQSVTRLTQSGEHFGSLMLKVDVEIQTDEDCIEKLHVVAKKLPTDPSLQEIFNVQVTFKNEIAFYDTIIPTLQDFHREQGVADVIDCFPEFYGARLGLSTTCDKPDVNHAVILLENLKESGYIHTDRYQGFDLDGAEVVLKDLALLHGIPLAMKLTETDNFERNIKITCHDFIPNQNLCNLLSDISKEVLKEDPECAKLVPKIAFYGSKNAPHSREPFATVTHGDIWLSNSLQKYKDGRVVKNKLLDFQFYSYRSPAADVLFFLWTSVQDEVLVKHFERLLKFYHYHLLLTLKQCNCATDAFEYEAFLKELKTEAEYEFGHALQFIHHVIHLDRDGVISEHPPTKESFYKLISKRAKEKSWFLVKECHSQGWI